MTERVPQQPGLGNVTLPVVSPTTWRASIAPSLSILTSAGTLICCALPALLVSLGAGAAVAGLVSAVPQLVWLSENKELVFGFAGLMLLLAGTLQWLQRRQPCPADKRLGQACMRMRRRSARIYAAAILLFSIGFFFAFLADDILV